MKILLIICGLIGFFVGGLFGFTMAALLSAAKDD